MSSGDKIGNLNAHFNLPLEWGGGGCRGKHVQMYGWKIFEELCVFDVSKGIKL